VTVILSSCKKENIEPAQGTETLEMPNISTEVVTATQPKIEDLELPAESLEKKLERLIPQITQWVLDNKDEYGELNLGGGKTMLVADTEPLIEALFLDGMSDNEYYEINLMIP
jgi:hypothetical protein